RLLRTARRGNDRETVVAARADGAQAHSTVGGADFAFVAVRADGEDRHGKVPRDSESVRSEIGPVQANTLPRPQRKCERKAIFFSKTPSPCRPGPLAPGAGQDTLPGKTSEGTL